MVLANIENIPFAQATDTVLKIDSFSANPRVCQEMVIQGTLRTVDDHIISGAEILIKNDPSMNKNNVYASDTTNVRGEFFVRTNVANQTGIVDTYAIYLGHQGYNASISDAKTMNVRAAYSYDPPCFEEYIVTTPQTVIDNPTTRIFTEPSVSKQTIHETTLKLLIREGSQPNFVNVFPELKYDSNFSLNIHTIELYLDGKLEQTIFSNRWSGDINVINVEQISVVFPGMDDPLTAYTSSSDTVLVPSSVLPPDPIVETVEGPVTRTVEQFVRSWDFGAMLIGLVIGGVVKVGLDHWPWTRAIKIVIFILAAIVMLILFVISEQNDIAENLKFFEPARLIPVSNANYLLFGLLIAYVFGWIKELIQMNNDSKKRDSISYTRR